MRICIASVLFTFLSIAIAAEQYNKYDSAAVKRFDEELRRSGIVLPSLTNPDEPADRPAPTATAPAGDFEGHWIKSQSGRPIAAFEGIPYARPPVGPLRFKVAEPLTSRLSNFKATKPGSQCVQKDFFIPNADIGGLEDCLFVNVYVPEKIQTETSKQLPVMFFVHGGGFITGRGDLYQSKVLLDKDVVFVTFNYRVGPLGFLTTEDEVIPGNLGLKDQVAALRWVHENIAAFGGNPNLITVFGQSAGGACTEFLMLSPLTSGLIQRVIHMSGSSLAPWAIASPGEMRQNVRKAAGHLGCSAESSEDLLTCLQTKTAEEISAVESEFIVWKPAIGIPFKPIIEGNVPGALLPHHPKKLFEDSPSNDVPYMTGITSDEGTFFFNPIFSNETLIREFDENFSEYAPTSVMMTQPSQKMRDIFDTLRRTYFSPGPFSKSNYLEAANLYTDLMFFWPAIKSEQLHRKNSKAPGFFYYFGYEGSEVIQSGFDLMGGAYGAFHGSDLFYLFTLFDEMIKFGPSDVLMSMLLADLYTSFARDGIPSSDLIKTKWLPVTTKGTDIEYLHIRSPRDVVMKKDLLPERWQLLKTLFESEQHEHQEL